jgi:hypothetical protein
VKDRQVAVRNQERQHRCLSRGGDFGRELSEVSFPILCEDGPTPPTASRPPQREVLILINCNAVRHITANADCLHPQSHGAECGIGVALAEREPPFAPFRQASFQNTRPGKDLTLANATGTDR